MKIEILYEDDNILAINKPAGLVVHGDGRSEGPFLTDWLMDKYPKINEVGEPARSVDGDDLPRGGIVHRLDRETSGVVLIAKTQKGFECLKKQFQDRSIKKKYIAWVWGEIKENFGTINRPIGRSKSDFRRWSAERGARGEMREAKTYWSKVKSLKLKVKSDNAIVIPAKAGISMDENTDSGHKNKTEKFTLVEIEPKTGRTHQIRVHFKAIGHPVAGDKLYAPKKPYISGLERMALHARSIEFENCEGNKVKVEADMPEGFMGIEVKH